MVTFTLSAVQVGQFVLAVVLPLLVGLVTKKTTDGGQKAILLAALTLVASMLGEAIDVWTGGGVYDIGQSLMLWLPTFVVSVATHYGLWKPTGVSGTLQGVGDTNEVG